MDQTGDAVISMRASLLIESVALLSLASSIWCSPALAQWTVGLAVGSDRFWGGSLETTSERRSFRPYRPTTFSLGVERQKGRLAIGLQVQYAEASLGLEGEGAAVVVEGVFTLVSISPEATYHVTSIGSGNRLRLHAGPLIEVWSIIDENSQTRLGLQGAVSLEVPLGGSLGGSVLSGIALTSSPFEAGQLGTDYDLRTLWRRRFAVGLQYRL
jgi:hypothetical protein